MADEPFYYAEGLTVRKRAVKSDGGTTMGFIVCECSEYVPGAAEEIAKALNRLPEAEAMLVDLAQRCNEIGGLGKAVEEWMVGA